MLETDPTKINDKSEDRMSDDFQQQIDSRILKTGEEYAASNKRQKAENKTRQENRNRIKEMGISTHAYQIAVKVVKDLTANERADWMRDFQMVVKVLGSKQAELWPEEALKAEQRVQRAKDKAAKAGRTQAEMDADSDANPRSDPSSGGAEPTIMDAIAAAGEPDIGPGTYHSEAKGQGETLEEREAIAGEQALAEAAPSIAKKPSQSAKAKAKRDAAGMH